VHDGKQALGKGLRLHARKAAATDERRQAKALGCSLRWCAYPHAFVIPLRDDTERERASRVALLAALALLVLAAVVLVSGSGGWAALLVAVNAGFVWVFGAGAEAVAGRIWLAVALVLGAAGGAMLAVVAGATGLGPVGAAAATGAALEAVVIHLARCRGARIMSIVLVPWFGGFAEVRATIWALVWAAVVIVLGALGAFGG